MPSLEIAAFNLPSAITACTSSASRIELCSNPHVGGLTPSLSTLISLKSHPEYIKAKSSSPSLSTSPSSSTSSNPTTGQTTSPIPVYVMIRPHANSFTYSEQDIQAMESSISSFLSPASNSSSGADGFVLGCLTSSGTIDVSTCTRLLHAARGRPCTFHRAFDSIPTSQMEEALEVLIGLGFKAVLSSGGGEGAVEGMEVLRKLVSGARGRIEVIVGGGVRGENLGRLMDGIGKEAGWFHSSAIVGDREMASDEEVRKMSEMLNR